MMVAFLGPEGTYTQAAVHRHFGHEVRVLPLESIDDVFHEVQAGGAEFGVVPVENSSEGTVNNTLDRFLTTTLHICGEIELRVEHCLVGRMAGLGEVRRVCAHPQAFGQCRGWLQRHLPEAEHIAVSSNAEGARRARDESGTAAIAGEVAAEIYRLQVLAQGIEDHDDNTTRFLVLGNRDIAAHRRGQDHAAGLGEATARSRRAVPPAGAAGEAQGQHVADRVASIASAQVGLRVLHRPGRACRGPAGGTGAGGAAAAGFAVSRAGLLSAGDPLDGSHRNPGRLAAASVRALAPYVIGKPISELARELGIEDESDIVKLASNENPLGASPMALQAMQQGAGGGLALSGWQRA